MAGFFGVVFGVRFVWRGGFVPGIGVERLPQRVVRGVDRQREAELLGALA